MIVAVVVTGFPACLASVVGMWTRRCGGGGDDKQDKSRADSQYER
jgi:hypothetical protein